MAASGAKPTRSIAVLIDGEYWTLMPFRKAEVKGFLPTAGYFWSRAEAERVADTFR